MTIVTATLDVDGGKTKQIDVHFGDVHWESIKVEQEEDDTAIADAVSDLTGYCVQSIDNVQEGK